MRDQNLDRLADVLVNFSTRVQRGELVRLSGDPVAMPLLEALYEAVVRAGAHPMLKIAPASCRDFFLQEASDEQLDFLNPVLLKETESIDVSIGLWADVNTKSETRLDPKRAARNAAAQKTIRETFFKRAAANEDPKAHPGVKPLRWVGTQFPTQASAQDAEMSLREYCDFVFKAGLLHLADPAAEWEKVRVRQQKVADYMTGKKEMRFRTKNGTDLRVNIEGMRWINCWGESNFPDGEVFTGPNLKGKDGGVNGIVRYSFPAVYQGHEVNDIEFTFKQGKVVDAKASKGLEFLLAMLDQDAGARFAGEIAMGTNYSITQYSKNTLFDEKIGGTFHLAVGAGYPETGNDNQSALHWDMVCDMRSGGTIEVDGEVIQRDGKFVFEGWPGRD